MSFLIIAFQKPFVIGFMVQSITKKEGQADQRNRSNLPYVAYLQMIDKFCALYDGTHKLCASVFRSAAISGFFRMRIRASWSVSCFGAADATVSADSVSVSAAAFPE